MAWLAIDTWLLTALSVGFLGLLFLVAYWGQQTSHRRWVTSPWVYGLSLGVSCTSWAFYGIVGRTATTGEIISPIYIGTILMCMLGWPLIQRLVHLSRLQNTSSMADLLALRYEQRPQIAGIVTLIALLGMIPYIAMQLRAISQSVELVTGSYQSSLTTTLGVALVLIVFAILFGARKVEVNRKNPGLVLAIAFSSIVKLLALVAVGVFTSVVSFSDFDQLWQQRAIMMSGREDDSVLASMVLGAVTVFTTPVLFHMIVVENHREQDLDRARWIYPLYLLGMALFVLPIAVAGSMTFPGGAINADTYVLTLPLHHREAALSILVFLGGLAAATAMVAVASIVLSNMVITDLVTPALVRLHIRERWSQTHWPKALLFMRRCAIALVLLFAFVFERSLDEGAHLSYFGVLAFVLLAQLAPALVAAVYWRGAGSDAAAAGIITGSLVWAYCLLLPSLLPELAWIHSGPLGWQWLSPMGLFGLDDWDSTSRGLLVSLLCNSTLLIIWSKRSKRSLNEQMQANLFVARSQRELELQLSNSDLQQLLRRFIDSTMAQSFSDEYLQGADLAARASDDAMQAAQRELASVLGGASARLVMNAATRSTETGLGLAGVAEIVSEASELFEFNRELLHAAVENIEQGIAVVDADMRLVAWNRRYQTILDYPDGILQQGMPIADLIQFNIQRGMIEEQDLDTAISKRLNFMRRGSDHSYQRQLPSGTVVEIRGQAMPGGGFVTTFADITSHVETERLLQRHNETLELKVAERTRELELARLEAEAANRSKSRFLAAASHDLMQPFNALSLFTDMLNQQVRGSHLEKLAGQINNSLSSAEALLTDLVEISKLDGRATPPQWERFPLQDVLRPLIDEFTLLANNRSVRLDYIESSAWVRSDRLLLRRIIQNFLSNAVLYAPSGDALQARVLVGARRRGEYLELRVIDNGPGIAAEDQDRIFREFERNAKSTDAPGLGLGLAICERIATLLGSQVELHSVPGKGSSFSIRVPMIQASERLELSPTVAPEKEQIEIDRRGSIWIVDNEPNSREALLAQISHWGYEAESFDGNEPWEQMQALPVPRLIIADYHLDQGLSGVAWLSTYRSTFGGDINAVICSADAAEHVRQDCIDHGWQFIRKPVKSLALKRLLRQN